MQPSNQTLRLVERDRLVPPQIQAESVEILSSEAAGTVNLQQNTMGDLRHSSTVVSFNSNANGLALGNSQMTSALVQEYPNGQHTLWNEDNENPATYYKTINGLGFYSCDACPFLCLNVNLFLEHKKKDYHFRQFPLTSLLKFKCIGCDNIFYSIIVLRYHLMEDHDCSSVEIEGIIQIIILINKAENAHLKVEIPPTTNENLAIIDNTNGAILSTSELNQSLHPMDTEITGENVLVDNSPSNETSDVFCADQEQVINGMQENNTTTITTTTTPNNNQNIIDKHIRCTVGNCKVRFTTDLNMNYHTRCHFEDGFRCVELNCQHFDKKWLNMMSHLWKVHSIDIEMHSCNQCGFKTNNRYRLNNYHINIHAKEKPFLCPECGNGFRTIKQLRNHRVIHKKSDKPPRPDLKCLQCFRGFGSKTLLQRHMATTHTEERPYGCNVCNYTTTVASSLRMHMRLHTGEKPFKCSECIFSTSDHNTLRKHKMRHTGQKGYKCLFCNYSCIQSCSYKQHLKNKHPGMDEGIMYSCNMCSYRTICKDMYTIHNIKHNEEPIKIISVPEPPSSSDVNFYEHDIKQVKIIEKSNISSAIGVNPLNTTMQPNETT